MKPKAILMTEDVVSLESVYEQSVIDALSEKVDFLNLLQIKILLKKELRSLQK